MIVTLEVGLERGNLVVLLPGAKGIKRTIPLPRGREQEILRVMLQAKQAGIKGIETKAEPTSALAHHLANHRRTWVDTCAHCVAERKALDGAKVAKYGPRGGRLRLVKQKKQHHMTMDELITAIASMSDQEREQLMKDLEQEQKGA